MEGEINNFIKVWSTILMSSCYCYGTTKLVPKGTIRFFMFLPVMCLFLHLPLYLSTITLSNPTAFFVTWLSTFKLLLLVFGNGPLSNPSLSFFHFVCILCFPFNIQESSSPKYHSIKEKKAPNKTWKKESDQSNGHHKPNSNTYNIGLISPWYYAKMGLFLISLNLLGNFKDKFPRNFVLFMICIYVYVALEVILGVVASIAQVLLRTRVEPPFTDPYLATSLQDFWGHRWNRVASRSLKSLIFYPTLNSTSRILGRKWAAVVAVVVTFIVSDLMHELLFYHLGRVRFGWGTPLFFLFHGVCVVIESTLKRKVTVKWRLPQIITGPLIFGFAICSFMWMVLPELLEHNVDGRVLDEHAAVAKFVKDLGLAWSKMGYNLLVHNLQSNVTRL